MPRRWLLCLPFALLAGILQSVERSVSDVSALRRSRAEQDAAAEQKSIGEVHHKISASNYNFLCFLSDAPIVRWQASSGLSESCP